MAGDLQTARFGRSHFRTGQVLVLQSGHHIAGLDPRHGDFLQGLVNPDTSTSLRLMQTALNQAASGKPDVLMQLSLRWSEAHSQILGMAEGVGDILDAFPDMAAIFTPDELRRCRTRAPYTRDMAGKIFGMTQQIYEELADNHGAAVRLEPPDAFGTYLYRFALGIVLFLMRWIREGSQIPKRVDKVRNDIIDLGIAVSASYFDGLMTDDAKARHHYDELLGALRFGNACLSDA